MTLRINSILVLALSLLVLDLSEAWSPSLSSSSSSTSRLSFRTTISTTSQSSSSCSSSSSTALHATKKQKQSSSTVQLEEGEEYVDPDAPADIVGSQFFGGTKEKDEFYDPVAEAEADLEYRNVATRSMGSNTATLERETEGGGMERIGGEDESVVDETDYLYHRFADRAAFKDDTVAAVASSLQRQMNAALYEDDADEDAADKDAAANDADYTYASNLEWTTPLQVKASHPLAELESALDFYRRVNVAITSGENISENNGDSTGTHSVSLRWELSVTWPIFYNPRVRLTGTSVVTINTDNDEIVRQVDTLDQSDMLSSTISQVLPRFWDFYHVGMSPSAEVMPKLKLNLPSNPVKQLLAPYTVYQIPPRLVLQPTILDLGDRDDGNAGLVPNHAFNCVIKTMGPQKQRYVPATPIQVRLLPQETGPLQLQWSIPVAVECLTSNDSALTVPPPDDETAIEKRAKCTYQWEDTRTVATLPYGGGPQDEAISNMRKRLYEKVMKDGLKPKLDDSGRPLFFFWQNNVKACYTEEGLGMAVYDWRPDFVKCNEVGIELESVEGAIVKSR
jgi:hypothetical protein